MEPPKPLDLTSGLSTEQQFTLKAAELSTEKMSAEQLQAMALTLYRELMVQRNYYESLIKMNWGL